MTHKKVSTRARMDPALQEPSKVVEMHSDVMHIDGKMFLVTATKPMQLTLQTPSCKYYANARLLPRK